MAQPLRPTSGTTPLAARIFGACFILLISGVFATAGAAVMWMLALKPYLKSRAAQTWESVPCHIQKSEVKRHRSRKGGSTYSVAIQFAYTFHGQPCQGSHYNFQPVASSGHKQKAAIVARHPAGKQTVCFVNPLDPSEAVLDRSNSASLVGFLFSIPFLTVGLLPVFYWRHQKKSARRDFKAEQARTHTDEDPSSLRTASTEAAYPLQPTAPRGQQMFGLLFICLFWNGIVSVFVVVGIGQLREGDSSAWFILLFMVPFLVIGLGIVGGLVGQILRLFHPRVELALAQPHALLGETASFSWQIRGRRDRVRSLQLHLLGQEEARYRSGKSTRTEKSIFLYELITETADSAELAAGTTRLLLPDEGVPTFEAEHNRVFWTIRVRADLNGLPDLDEDFTLPVHALPPTALHE